MDHQTIIWSLALLVLANILGIWRVTASQNKRFDDKFNQVQASFNNKFSTAREHVDQAFAKVTMQFSDISIQMTKILEGDIRELKIRILKLEDDLNTSRTRYHDLNNKVTKMTVLIDKDSLKD